MFVLYDNSFKWVDQYALSGKEDPQMDTHTRETVVRLLHFPCGVLRGALTNLGMSTVVTAEINPQENLPSVVFNLRRK